MHAYNRVIIHDDDDDDDDDDDGDGVFDDSCFVCILKGETSAGKSTIINKIIGGSKLLPTKVTASTTKVCRIGYSKSFSVSTKDWKGKELKTLKFPAREDLSKTVKQLVTEHSTDFVYVDIGIPFPLLQV